MKKILLFAMLMFSSVFIFAQSVSGKVVDGKTGDGIIGASVLIEGTSIGTVTDIDGSFKLSYRDVTNPVLVINYLGYSPLKLNLDNSANSDLGNLRLVSSALGMEEIVVTGVTDIVRDRRTPVAVSTITAAEIQAKAAGNVELPEVAKATPSIFIANQAGGFGDSEVWTRGFDQTNTAFLLNGQPINGMEDGRMYWSNWSGLTDVASAVQIQRGLGASKLAISSVGGTWNFVMKATDNEEGGNVFTTIGNNNYRKVGASYSTGMINDKFGVTVLLSNWSGDGWAYGTRGTGSTYFISAGFKPFKNHTFNVLLTGAPQWHDQKFQVPIFDHEDENGDIDPRYNSNWGVYDGNYFTERRNYYHKPILNLNYDWKISDNSSFSTVVYGSMGRGGGTGGLGGGKVRTESGLINFDATAAQPDSVSGYIRRASVNNHNWFGTVLKYNQQFGQNFNFSLGSDLRRYYGDHFRQVEHLVGRDGYTQDSVTRFKEGYTTNKTFSANPYSALFDFAQPGERIAYNNAETIKYIGGFGQLEYAANGFSAYLQGAISTQNHVRHELFYATEEEEDSEKVVNNGYNLKGGASYTFLDNHTVFVNAGTYSRQPFHDVVFVGNSNVVNENTSNEDILGFEVGYKFGNSNLYANINAYYTAWNNRVEFNSLQVQDDGTVALTNGEQYNAIGDDPYELVFQDQLHQGIELDLGWNATERFTLKGFGSFGNWNVVGDRDVQLFDGVDARDLVREYVATGEDIHVGGAPQTSFGLGAKYTLFKNFNAEVNYFHYEKLFAANGGIELPAYDLVDLNLSYAIPFDNGNVLRLGGNIYNLFNQLYISKSRTSNEADELDENNWNGINKSNQVTFGQTRTYNFTMKYSF